MRTWLAILLTVGLVTGCVVIFKFTGENLFGLLIVGTSVWAGIDSAKLELTRYRSGISYGPVVLGVLCAGFWIVGFPWYLSMRYKIKTGKAHLRCEYESPMSEGQMGPKGLIQPWRNREL